MHTPVPSATHTHSHNVREAHWVANVDIVAQSGRTVVRHDLLYYAKKTIFFGLSTRLFRFSLPQSRLWLGFRFCNGAAHGRNHFTCLK